MMPCNRHMSEQDIKDAWVRRVFGVDMSSPPAKAMTAIWAAAKTTVATQLAALQAACEEYDDRALQMVAQADLLEGLQDAAEDLEWALASGDDIEQALQAMSKAIDADEKVGALDANPMAVPVTIEKTLQAALQDMLSKLQSR
jgi:hypothetical protein